MTQKFYQILVDIDSRPFDTNESKHKLDEILKQLDSRRHYNKYENYTYPNLTSELSAELFGHQCH